MMRRTRSGGRNVDWGRRWFVVGWLLAVVWSICSAAPEETPEAKVGCVEKEVAAAIEEFRRSGVPSVLDEQGYTAIRRGADNRVVRSPSARARLWSSAITLWLEAWQARPYKDVVRDVEKSKDLKEFFADSSPEGPEKWARRDALRAKAIRDGELRMVCGLIQSELGSQYGTLYGFDGGAHAKEYMGELERLWAGRPWFAVFSTNVVEDIEMKFAGKRPTGATTEEAKNGRAPSVKTLSPERRWLRPMERRTPNHGLQPNPPPLTLRRVAEAERSAKLD